MRRAGMEGALVSLAITIFLAQAAMVFLLGFQPLSVYETVNNLCCASGTGLWVVFRGGVLHVV